MSPSRSHPAESKSLPVIPRSEATRDPLRTGSEDTRTDPSLRSGRQKHFVRELVTQDSLEDADFAGHKPARKIRGLVSSGYARFLRSRVAGGGLDGSDVIVLPLLSEPLGLLDGAVFVDTGGIPARTGSLGEAPDSGNGAPQEWIARLPPGRILHLTHVPKLPDGHQSSSIRKRRLRASASARSLSRTVSFFIR